MSLSGGADAEVGAGDAAIAIMYNWTIYTQYWLWNHTTVYRLHLRWYPGRQELFKAQLNSVNLASIHLHFSEWNFKVLFFYYALNGSLESPAFLYSLVVITCGTWGLYSRVESVFYCPLA